MTHLESVNSGPFDFGSFGDPFIGLEPKLTYEERSMLEWAKIRREARVEGDQIAILEATERIIDLKRSLVAQGIIHQVMLDAEFRDK